ncbi:MerR family transcriptional regulator [Nonomuraea dietziae]|uniref:DNA-binding transcriptional MerR regulator n=1 Tax=Nonomuraea dietziae TaxID=65515 RepID=A0A7W5Y6C9_9ACTN|nr:MerR family transcriptional regulator [Nonomuraea dietziae]MBB3726291.1 DNA-binding transcriptional MerR regulator [Nonomuraea dietziae]
MPALPFDDDHAPLYSLGQVADMLQVQQAYLRRLDQHEVVSPARSTGGQRRYSRHDIMTVQHVTQMADEGMTLIAIRRILDLEREVRRLRQELKAAQGPSDRAGLRTGARGRSGVLAVPGEGPADTLLQRDLRLETRELAQQ